MPHEKHTVDPTRVGIANLLAGTSAFDHFIKISTCEVVPLQKHPLGLKLNTPNPSDLREVNLVGWPLSTYSSVNAMLVILRAALAKYCTSDPAHVGLRIIRGVDHIDERGIKKHLVWFEVTWSQGTFIGGGCNDFSGGANSGRQMLESVFIMLKDMPDITFEDVTIPFERGQAALMELQKAHRNFHRKLSA